MESEVKKSTMLQYISYLKDQFELVESYFDMIQKTTPSKKLELNHIQNKIEFVKQTNFRLSDDGYEFLVKELDLKEYEIPFTEPIELSPQTIIFLERYVDCPYYLTNMSITVFSERKSFELMLFSDDIRKFGLIKAMNEREKELAKID